MHLQTVFKYTTVPYLHQIEALQAAWDRKAFAYFLEQGTGKSKIIVDEIVNSIERNRIDCAIIIAPNNVHVNWKSELIKHGPLNYERWDIYIYRSTDSEDKRDKALAHLLGDRNQNRVPIFLINIEALSTIKGTDFIQKILRQKRYTYLAIDESHKIKSPSAKRTKAAIQLGKFAAFRRIATGTEAEEGLEDLFSQFKFLDPNIIGINSFTAFRGMFCIMGGFENREVKGYQNEQILAQRIRNFAYQKRKKDCLDLPEKVYRTHEISMTKQQFEIYHQLEEELLYELSSGAIVDAQLAITKVMRLQQVLCGHLNASDNESRSKPQIIPSYRNEYIAELVEEASGKVIIFCRFIADVGIICNALANSNIKSVGISGEVNSNDRMGEIAKWRDNKDIKVLAITVATGGTGLTLNEANTTIFFSNSWSATDRLQAEDRNHRIGQNDKVTYHDIIVPGAIDDRLLNALREKRMLSQEFRSLVGIKKFITGE
jgi:SNF2 family DNA or RNA helicase